jgi:hypothetical protein
MGKKIIGVLLLIISCYKAEAQNEKNSNYVFNDYQDAAIKFKSGPNIKVKLNYNTVTEEMIYLQGSTPLAIAETANIDTIFVKGLKFIPIDNAFYQVISLKDRQLYIRYTAKAVTPAVDTGLELPKLLHNPLQQA